MRNINEIEEFDKSKTKVLKYILYKRRTESEIRNKFIKMINEDDLEEIISYFKEMGYINDKDYIERQVNDFMILKNLSLKEIKFKLLRKGLNKNDIEDYFEENEEKLKSFEIKSAKNIIYKKKKDMEIEDIKNFLFRKGYNIDNVNKALDGED